MKKQLTPLQKVFGCSYQGRCQKRYRHKRQYNFHKQGKKLFFFTISDTPNVEIEKEGILKDAEKCQADKVTLRWSAMGGFPPSEVVVWTKDEGFVNEEIFV